jgi:hypothetical protein
MRRSPIGPPHLARRGRLIVARAVFGGIAAGAANAGLIYLLFIPFVFRED